MLNFSRMEPEIPDVPFEELDSGQTFQILLDAVQKAIDEGVITPGPDAGLYELAYNLWGLGHGLATLQLMNLKGLAFDFAAADRAAFKAFLTGLNPGSGSG
jgi:hypothetical protein